MLKKAKNIKKFLRKVKMNYKNMFPFSDISILSIKKLDNFFKNQNIEVKSDIFSEKRNEFFKLKNENPNADFTALDLAAFYNAIQNFYELKEKSIKKIKQCL